MINRVLRRPGIRPPCRLLPTPIRRLPNRSRPLFGSSPPRLSLSTLLDFVFHFEHARPFHTNRRGLPIHRIHRSSWFHLIHHVHRSYLSPHPNVAGSTNFPEYDSSSSHMSSAGIYYSDCILWALLLPLSTTFRVPHMCTLRPNHLLVHGIFLCRLSSFHIPNALLIRRRSLPKVDPSPSACPLVGP